MTVVDDEGVATAARTASSLPWSKETGCRVSESYEIAKGGMGEPECVMASVMTDNVADEL